MAEENVLTSSELSNIESRLYEFKSDIQALRSRYNRVLATVNSTSEEIRCVKTSTSTPFVEIERNLDTNIQIVSNMMRVAK